jgi:cytochrome c oxidase assembly protein subunit 15
MATPALRRLAWAFAVLTGMTYALVVFGAVVRAQGAGLAGPDWPLCFGQLVPRLDFGVVFEWGHRALASVVSLGLLGLIIATWFVPVARKLIGRYLIAAVAVLFVQIILGGLTVLHLLASWTVTSHLLVGNAFALSLGLISATLFKASRPAADPLDLSPSASIGWHLVGLVLLAQMTLGGLVASNFAGLACVTWPACVGDAWFPTFTGPVGLHVMHRITAYALVLAVLAATALSSGPLRRLGLVASLVVLAQVALGVANVLMHLPVEVTAGHSAGAAALCLLTALSLQMVYTRGRARNLTTPAAAPALTEAA